ncbi:amidase [Hymenobacter edaphi]|uniref:Amidase n=1 Tax=Hymenobacter edaphi TaxID=2211146 RepID=A0A328BJ55_9BACT|nr:amidase [Hymenobacter edaphi]RAK66685.1 amidase [Hymenobacter edaphi]
MQPLYSYLLSGAACFALGALTMRAADGPAPITIPGLRAAQEVLGLRFTDAQLDSARRDVAENRDSYEALRKLPLPNGLAPVLVFDPVPLRLRNTFVKRRIDDKLPHIGKMVLPASRDDLAYYSVRQLGELLRTRQISSEELTTFFLARLKKYDPKLLCVTTLTEELALRQARQADADLKAGRYKGPLHGVPFGVKDLFSTKGYRTTWGSVPYKEQTLDEDAAVVTRLREAGAVLVAKFTLGELAMGDVWYGGMTRSPWDLTKGSSGSSAGSASAVAAGLVPFAIGTETLGSIVSPSTACGTTGLRPTFGRVSRAGAMALSWSMDKAGPIARSAEDCALVLDALVGRDPRDPATLLARTDEFYYEFNTDLKKLRVGYVKADFDRNYPSKANDQASLEVLRKLGVQLVALELPKLPASDMTFLLTAEGAAAFDDLTRSGRDALLVKQDRNAWPSLFRASRFVPAVEYLQAQRARRLLIEELDARIKDLDAYVAPSFGGPNLVMTNLTGHPAVVLPNGMRPNGLPSTITFTGQLYEEARLLALAKAFQDATDFDEKHPPLNF